MVVSKIQTSKQKNKFFQIDSVLDKGLRSKVIWGFYLQSSNVNQNTKFIYGKGDSLSGTIGKYAKELEKLGYLEAKNGRYFVKTGKIAVEIEKFLAGKGISLYYEEKEILNDLLCSLSFRNYFIVTTSKNVSDGDSKVGGFLALMCTVMALNAMWVINESKLNKKIILQDNSGNSHTVFRGKITKLDIQHYKDLEKLNPDTLLFFINYFQNLFLLIPKGLLEKLTFLNIDVVAQMSYITDGGREFYVPMDKDMKKIYKFRRNFPC